MERVEKMKTIKPYFVIETPINGEEILKHLERCGRTCYKSEGNIKEDSGVIDKAIARSKKDRKKMAVDSSGRCAVTYFTVKERFIDYTLVEFKLATGRTHQIRVHAKDMKHAVVGDRKYGHIDHFGLNGQLLHAYKLTVFQPTTGEEMTFEAPLPDYFEKVLIKLRKEKQD